MALVGTSVVRFEDERLVRGAGRFVADETAPGVTHAAILRSPAACGTIRRLDVTAARACDGVLAVFTAADIAADGLGGIPWEVCPPGFEKEARFPGDPAVARPQPLLADGVVRYVGEPVALVVADTLLAAIAATDAIELDIDLADPVVGLPPDPADDSIAPLFSSEVGDRARTGAVLADAFETVQLRTYIPRLAAAPIEPRGYLSCYDGASGTWTITAAAGKPNPVRDTIAKQVLHVEPERIRLVAGDIGGGFGGKNVAHAEAALTLWAAKRIGRPVRWIATRLDAFLSDMQGRDHLINATLAYDRRGRFLAVSYDSLMDLGAYLSPRGVMPGLTSLKTITGPYRIDTAHGRVRGLLTNTVPTCTYRGAGAPESAFALERLVDMAARKLSLAPEELRRRNLVTPDMLPWPAPTGVTFHSVNFPAVLAEAMSGFERKRIPARRSSRRRRGIGCAFSIECYGTSLGESAEIVVRPGMPVDIRIGTKSSGQSHETVYAQVASDAIGLPPRDFRIVQGDTALVLRGNGTGASRSLTSGGSAILTAARALLVSGRRLAAAALQCPEEDLDYHAGEFRTRGTLAGSIDLRTLAGMQPDGQLRAEADFKPSLFTIPGGCHVAEVEVDMDTGSVRLLRYRAVHDAGVAVNPMVVSGQLHGGIMQGIGAALGEALRYDASSGQLVTASFQDYAMPRAATGCTFDIRLLGVPCASNLLGAKPVGEAGTVAAPPAIVNAILDAVGERDMTHLELPASAMRLWSALNPN